LLFTARKAAHLVRDEHRDKRGGGKVRAEADLAGDGVDSDEGFLARVLGSEPTPEFAAEMAEECRLLLDKLGTEELRSIAVWTMEGNTVEEIAARLGRSVRTVARKLAVIRELCVKRVSHHEPGQTLQHQAPTRAGRPARPGL
jgi:DNA-directed RNA polymerase specialized sigma24 family protein